jgi:ribonuclease BN (tRNA processing enzyme)
MEIFFLGTGTAVPVRMHSPAGLLIISDGQPVLLDIGPGTLGRLELAGFSCTQLDQLFLTHFHSDHTLDLATLLQVFNYTPNVKRTRPFSITACPGIQDFYLRMVNLYPELAPLTYELNMHEVFRDAFSTGMLKIRTAPTGHTPESIAYRLEADGHSLVYSGDAASSGELAGLAAGVDLLICECSFPSGWETDDHLNADTAGRIAQDAGVKSLVLTHTYPPALAVDLVAQVRRHYDGIVQLAVDGLHLSL